MRPDEARPDEVSGEARPDDAADDGPAPAGSVGDARVDTVLERLEELADLPVESHPEVYDAIHARLREVLSGLDDDGEPA